MCGSHIGRTCLEAVFHLKGPFLAPEAASFQRRMAAEDEQRHQVGDQAHAGLVDREEREMTQAMFRNAQGQWAAGPRTLPPTVVTEALSRAYAPASTILFHRPN